MKIGVGSRRLIAVGTMRRTSGPYSVFRILRQRRIEDVPECIWLELGLLWLAARGYAAAGHGGLGTLFPDDGGWRQIIDGQAILSGRWGLSAAQGVENVQATLGGQTSNYL
jgi:hypothetical protein